MDRQTETRKTQLYFDSLCRVCSAEIEHYRKQDGSDEIEFIDIMDPSFEAKVHGLDPAKVHRVLHARGPGGELHEGVDAFRAVWSVLPRYRFLARLSKNRAVRLAMDAGYELFVKVRPYLPRKKADCSASPYCEVKK